MLSGMNCSCFSIDRKNTPFGILILKNAQKHVHTVNILTHQCCELTVQKGNLGLRRYINALLLIHIESDKALHIADND